MTYDEKAAEYYMSLALEQAKAAFEMGEVPVGAVIVWEGRVVSRACNRRESGKNALYHAELSAINEACNALGGWRLHKASLFVTLEPCVMCAGACVNARIAEVYFGARDPKAGAFGSVLDVRDYPLNHKPAVCAGIMEAESGKLLSEFFLSLRRK